MDIAHTVWDANLFTIFKIQIKKKKKRLSHNLILKQQLLLFQRKKRLNQLQSKTLFFNKLLLPEVSETNKLPKLLRDQWSSSETF